MLLGVDWQKSWRQIFFDVKKFYIEKYSHFSWPEHSSQPSKVAESDPLTQCHGEKFSVGAFGLNNTLSNFGRLKRRFRWWMDGILFTVKKFYSEKYLSSTFLPINTKQHGLDGWKEHKKCSDRMTLEFIFF